MPRTRFKRARFDTACPLCPDKIRRGDFTERNPDGGSYVVHTRCAEEFRNPARKRRRLTLERVAVIRAMDPAAIRDGLRVRDRLRHRLTPGEANRLTIDAERL